MISSIGNYGVYNMYNSYSKMFGSSSTSSSSGVSAFAASGNFDYKAAQAQLKLSLANGSSSSGSNKVSSMKKDTAAFLDSYTSSMTDLRGAAQNLSKAAQKIPQSGEIDEKTMKAVTDAAQKLVESYNATQTTLLSNTSRGTGVETRSMRITQALGSGKELAQLGISVDGTTGKLSLDTEALTEKLSTDYSRELTTSILGGQYSLAQRMESAANSGLNQSAQSLINKDLQAISAQQESITSSLFGSSSSALMYSGKGVYTMSNIGALGMMMNMLA